MENYFDVFKEKINNRFRILRKLVEDYKDDFFLRLVVIMYIFKLLRKELHG